VLVVEDDPEQRTQLAGFLHSLSLAVRTAGCLAEAREALDQGAVDVVLSDLRLPDGTAVELLAWSRPRHPLADFVVVTAYGSVETAVQAMRHGAHDFLTKPVHLDVLEQRLGRLLEKRLLAREVRQLRERLADRIDVAGTVAESPAMQRVLALLRKVAPTDTTLLVTGETGTGKELVATLVHEWSPRRAGPFLKVNCAALPEPLLESELFGHARGAFTGADRERDGLFLEAHGGTLLLDEIGEVSLTTQAKLLRVLQEREVRRVGDTRPRPVDVRVVAATNRELAAEVAAGRFRQDLLFRLAVIPVRLPPLRERPEDVAALVPVLLRRFAGEAGVPVPGVSREAHDLLLAHPWPGNVRELQNALQRAVILAGGATLRCEDLPEALRALPEEALPCGAAAASLPEMVAALERRAIRRALSEHGGVRTRAAESLGISERVLRYKLDLYGLDSTKSSSARRERRDPAGEGA
jgi:DNA-binding NtrC family response regulator